MEVFDNGFLVVINKDTAGFTIEKLRYLIIIEEIIK